MVTKDEIMQAGGGLGEKLTPQIGNLIWKTPSAHNSSGVGDFT